MKGSGDCAISGLLQGGRFAIQRTPATTEHDSQETVVSWKANIETAEGCYSNTMQELRFDLHNKRVQCGQTFILRDNGNKRIRCGLISQCEEAEGFTFDLFNGLRLVILPNQQEQQFVNSLRLVEAHYKKYVAEWDVKYSFDINDAVSILLDDSSENVTAVFKQDETFQFAVEYCPGENGAKGELKLLDYVNPPYALDRFSQLQDTFFDFGLIDNKVEVLESVSTQSDDLSDHGNGPVISPDSETVAEGNYKQAAYPFAWNPSVFSSNCIIWNPGYSSEDMQIFFCLVLSKTEKEPFSITFNGVPVRCCYSSVGLKGEAGSQAVKVKLADRGEMNLYFIDGNNSHNAILATSITDYLQHNVNDNSGMTLVK
jgi:hypothetical protein